VGLSFCEADLCRPADFHSRHEQVGRTALSCPPRLDSRSDACSGRRTDGALSALRDAMGSTQGRLAPAMAGINPAPQSQPSGIELAVTAPASCSPLPPAACRCRLPP